LSLPLLLLITLVLILIGAIVDILLHGQLDTIFPAYVGLYPVTIIAAVLSWYPQMAVVIKRLHDRNKRARWFWLAQIPFLGPVWLIIETGFLRGTVGPNEWGDDPRVRRQQQLAEEPAG
jgi:uncharacterized membrane protein YhaH (DUF805 family)